MTSLHHELCFETGNYSAHYGKVKYMAGAALAMFDYVCRYKEPLNVVL